MALSRPSRALASPPLSPRQTSSRPSTSTSTSTSDRQRRKSSSGKAVRPKMRAHRDVGVDEDRGVVGESFLSFCTFCDKQMNTSGSSFLYCSESCRLHDLSSHSTPASPPLSPYTRPLSTYLPPDGPDIIPRASPSISLPLSLSSTSLFTPNTYTPHPAPSHASKPSLTTTNSTALASLRSLSTALDASRSRRAHTDRKDSSASSDSDTTDAEWASTSPAWGYNAFAARSYNYQSGGGSIPYAPAYGLGGRSAGERPLPPRSGGFSHRPRSVDLVTPFSGAV